MKPSPKLILGSNSPRRKELLSNAGFEFQVEKLNVDENFPSFMPSDEVAEYLAKEKNVAYRAKFENHTIVTADTVVVCEDKILGKPIDRDQATVMLESLSDKVHQVITGVCISNPEKTTSFSNITEVKIKPLKASEISYYVNDFKPFDKAGAYGIQEWFGLIGVEWIKGSYYNVVGLPIDAVYTSLINDFDILVDYKIR